MPALFLGQDQGGEGGTGNTPGGSSDILATRAKRGGVNSNKAAPDPFPEVKWVSVSDGTRNIEEMPDRAAKFLIRANLIKANKDFTGFKDLIEYYLKEFKEAPNSEEIIVECVHEAFQQVLMETVAGALALKGRNDWTQKEIEDATSEEALTAACMQRYHQMEMINRNCRSKLSLKAQSVSVHSDPVLT